MVRSFSLSTVALVGALAEEPKFNLLFLMADQLKWDSNGYSGVVNPAFKTPALNRIAKEGVEFRYSWSSTPTCTPARAGLLTGRSPWRHGMLGYGEVAPVYPVEMPRVLGEAGYNTAVIGKDHFGWNATSDSGISHGFQQSQLYDGLGSWAPSSRNSWSGEWDDYTRWFSEEMPGADPSATLDFRDGDGWNDWHGAAYMYNESLHPTAWTGRKAVNFLKSYPNETNAKPFMLKVSFHRPHSPYDPPQRLLDDVKPEDLRPINLCQDASSSASADDSGQGAGWCLRFRGAEGDAAGCGNRADAWCGEMPETDAVLSRRAYAASVNFVDEWVGHIYDSLVERNLLERTFIIWTSDHGDGQGDMYHWRKGYPYEFSAHVPMLMRWPESWSESVVPRGTTIMPPLVTELRDVFHTLVDAAGATSLVPARGSGHPDEFGDEDGKSMLCLLRDPTGETCNYPPNPGPWRKWLDMEHATCYNGTNHWSALTDGRMKYIFRASLGDEQLFNLTADPIESMELSASPEYTDELQKWRSRMVQQFEQEGRGKSWVQNGKLVKRTQAQTYSPFYPPTPPAPPPPALPTPQAGDAVVMFTNGGRAPPGCGTNDCWILKSLDGQRTGLQLMDAPDLCLSVVNDSSLDVEPCRAVDSQYFTTSNHTANADEPIAHVPSGRCVAASKASGDAAIVVDCVAGSDRQLWLFGSSGRLCASKFGSFCLHADEKNRAMSFTITV